MPRLPQISSRDVVRHLPSLGYEVIRQRGSHVRLRKSTTLGEHNITVPVHTVLAKGTLADILNKTGLWNNIAKGEVLERLKQDSLVSYLASNFCSFQSCQAENYPDPGLWCYNSTWGEGYGEKGNGAKL